MARLCLELPVDVESNYVYNFFEGQVDLIEAFYSICNHLFKMDPEIIIRHEEKIIGACKHGEYYRFYVLAEDGEFYIKYKHVGKRERFDPSQIEKYKAENIGSFEFFAENREVLLRKVRENRAEREQYVRDNDGYTYPMFISPNDHEKWKQIRRKGKNTQLDDEDFNKLYESLVSIVYDLCNSVIFLSEIDYDIVKNRILTTTDQTVVLQELADKYGITRERIRQRERSSWKRIKRYFFGRQSKIYPEYRERLADLLLEIPDAVVVTTAERICEKSKILGSWITEIYGLQ